MDTIKAVNKQAKSVGSVMAASAKTFVPIGVDSSISEMTRQKHLDKEEEARKRCGKLLLELGWGSGFRLPFANKDNQALEKDLEFKQRKILALQEETIDNDRHTKTIMEHFDRIKDDIKAYQTLLESKKAVIEEEKNYLNLAERMQSKILQDSSSAESKIKEHMERIAIVQRDFDRRLKAILELRDIIEFDSEALQQYNDRMKQYEENFGEVYKLNEEDEKTLRELESSRVELGAQKRELRHELDQQAMNTSKFQDHFDRMAIEFRKVHRQRFDMIGMWASTLQHMKEKDDKMSEITDEYFETRRELRELVETLEDRERHLREETCGIRGTELILSEIDRKLDETRRRLAEEKDLFTSYNDAVALYRVEIHNTSNQAQTDVDGLVELEYQLKKTQDKICWYQKLVMKLKDQVAEIHRNRGNADSKIVKLEKILDEEERTHDRLQKEVDAYRKYFWERSFDKNNTEEEIRSTDTTILRVHSNLHAMLSKAMHSLDYIAKRSSQIYRLDLECSILENRINLMTNQSINPQYFDLQRKIRHLREVDKKFARERKYITAELDHVEQMTAKCNHDIGKSRREELVLDAQLQQSDMLSHGLEKLMDKSIKELNDQQVRNSLERVFLAKLMDRLKNERQQMFGLAEIRNTIHWAVQERKLEIENHKALNMSREKALRDAIGKLRVQVAEVVYRTEKLRGRFQLITILMAPPGELDPEEQSLAYQARKVARDRETLLVEQQKWKVRLEEGEKELEGLINVNKIMLASNSALKDTLSPADESSPERQELEALNLQEKEIMLRRNRAKKYRAIIHDRTQDLEQQLGIVEQEVVATNQLTVTKEVLSSKVQNELHRQKEKANRWAGMCTRLLREIKQIVPEDRFEFLQKDLKLRFTISKFESSVTMLERLLVQYPFLRGFLLRSLKNHEFLMKLYYRMSKVRGGSPQQLKNTDSTQNTATNIQSLADYVEGDGGADSVIRVVPKMSPRSRFQAQNQTVAGVASRVSTIQLHKRMSKIIM